MLLQIFIDWLIVLSLSVKSDWLQISNLFSFRKVYNYMLEKYFFQRTLRCSIIEILVCSYCITLDFLFKNWYDMSQFSCLWEIASNFKTRSDKGCDVGTAASLRSLLVIPLGPVSCEVSRLLKISQTSSGWITFCSIRISGRVLSVADWACDSSSIVLFIKTWFKVFAVA